jgi:hypothetical protein
MNYPQQADGVSEHDEENLSQMRHPRMFNRGPVPVSPGFQIEAFGNDGPKRGLGMTLYAAAAGESKLQ